MTRIRDFRSIGLAALAAAALLAALPAARAGEPAAERTSVRVRYDDLDLATDIGVHRLYARLQQAAARVCPDRYDRQPARAGHARACQAAAIDAAVAQVNSPRLAALRARDAARG